MADKVKLEIITPLETVLETEADWVTVPGSQGELGILPDHVPLVTTMDSGVLQYAEAGRTSKVAIHYGYAQVQGNRVTVLSDMAEKKESIDLGRAKDAERRAREKLQELISAQEKDDRDMSKYESKLRRALARKSVGG